MPDDGRQIAKVTNQDLQALPFDQAFEVWSPNIATALPDHIPLDRFRRVVITAVNQNAKLARADRRSLFNACAKCAHDGLYPDGREAALIVYSTKVKRGEDEFWVDMVQYLPMIAGIRKRMRNTGEVLSATAEVVYRKDHFRYIKGEDPRIEHEPCELGEERGERRGAYAIIKLANGEVLRETMSASDIEYVMRTFAKGWDKKSSPWQTSRDEMWRKTVLRRCSKAAPNGSELDRIFARDDERDPPHPDSPLRAIPPRPQPENYLSITDADTEEETEGQVESGGPTFEVVDFDGELVQYRSAEDARNAIIGLMTDPAPRSVMVLDGIWESNASTVAQIAEAIEDGAEPLHQVYAATKKALQPPAGTPGQTEHPEGRQSSTPDRKENTPNSSPEKTGAAAPRDEPQRTAESDTLQKLAAAATDQQVVYWTRKALTECREAVDTDELWRDHEKRYLRLGMVDQKEVRDMFKQRNRVLQGGEP